MNNHIIDLTGNKFGRLTVKEFVRSENGNALWKKARKDAEEKYFKPILDKMN